MRSLIRLGYLIIVSASVIYLVRINPPFPGPPPDALQSDEPADTETVMRRAYFTDYTREQVVEHYKTQLNFLPTLRLNYPPEEGQTLIRDQTRSSYLEELVHPFRTSLYVNGFIPSTEKDTIIIKGQHFEQKITVRLVESNRFIRVFIALITALVIWFMLSEWKNLFFNLNKNDNGN